MGQIGEFAFIVAKSGQDLGVTSDFLLPIIGVATITTAFLTPYLINFSFKKNGAVKMQQATRFASKDAVTPQPG